MTKLKKNLYLLLCLFFASLNFNLILKPLNLVTGGTQGAALLGNHLIDWKPSTIVLLINAITLLISFFLLTKENTYSALVSTFAYPLFIKITSTIPTFFSTESNFILVYVLIAGIICGVTGGLIYKLGFSSGGITIINLLLQKYIHIKVSIANFITNTIIILLGYFHFGLLKTIYSILVIAIGSFIINQILKKSSKSH